MVAWSRLPVEIRHEIVKKMDFRTRFRFRHVSKTDQLIVDSISLKLPRIVLNFESDRKVVLEFYLGINRKITVEFENAEEVVVRVRVSGESIDNPIQKYVYCGDENSALLAVTAFKNVAIHPKTLLEGLEFRQDHRMTVGTGVKIYQLFKNKQIRTKILCVTQPTHLSLVLPHCSNSDLLEVQSIDNDPDGGMIPLSMITHTRKFKIDVEELPEGRFYQISNTYMPDSKRTLRHVQSESQMMGFPGFKRVEKGPGDVFLTGWLSEEFFYHRINLCGDLLCTSDLSFQRQDSGDCELRWACAKHSDPFEYWYLQQIIKPKPANLNGFAPERLDELIEIARGLVGAQFHLPQHLPMDLPTSYREHVLPISNGVDPVQLLIEEMTRKGIEFEQEMLKKFEDCAKLRAKKKEEAEEKVEEKVLDEEEAIEEMCNISSTEARDSEGSEAPEAKEANSKIDECVSAAMESDDFDADEEAGNPFNTEEFQSKFYGSNLKIDKFGVFLMIFAVLSVIFALFFTFV